MHLARRSTPKVAHIGGVLAVIGLATLPGLLVTDYYDLALAQALPRAQSVAIADDAASTLGRRRHAGHHDRADVLRARDADGRGRPRRCGASFWAPIAVAVGWILPFASGTGLVPAAAGAILIGVALIPIGVRVARMSDQTWAEWTVRAHQAVKAPKMAVESAA